MLYRETTYRSGPGLELGYWLLRAAAVLPVLCLAFSVFAWTRPAIAQSLEDLQRKRIEEQDKAAQRREAQEATRERLRSDFMAVGLSVIESLKRSGLQFQQLDDGQLPWKWGRCGTGKAEILVAGDNPYDTKCNGSRYCLSRAIEAFLRQMAADGRTPASIQSYRRQLMLLTQALDDVPLSRLTPDRLNGYLSSPGVQLKADAMPKQASTINRTKSVIRALFRWCDQTGRLRVIVGDSNMSEVSTYLKVGTTAIVPDMIEDGFFDKDWSLHHAFFVRLPDFPAGPFRATNRDRYNKPRGTAGIRVKNRPGERRIRVSTSESERKDAMGGTIRARVRGGMLEPLEEIDLPEGKEVMVTILEVPSAEDDDAFRRAAGSWKDLVDTDTLIRNIYADRLLSTRPEPRL